MLNRSKIKHFRSAKALPFICLESITRSCASMHKKLLIWSADGDNTKKVHFLIHILLSAALCTLIVLCHSLPKILVAYITYGMLVGTFSVG